MGFELFIFARMVSLLLNEDPQLDHFKAPTSHTRRSIVRTVQKNDDLDIPVALLHKPICKGFFSDIIFK